MGIRIDDDTFTELVKESANVADLIRKTGRSNVASSFVEIQNRIERLSIDVSHFRSSAASKSNGKRRTRELTADEILVKGRHGKRREQAPRLKAAMLNRGFVLKCSECQISDCYNGKPIQLQIDRINGDPTDNTVQNLRFLCPNCHSQTNTFGHRNIKRPTRPKAVQTKASRPTVIKPSKKLRLKCIGCHS